MRGGCDVGVLEKAKTTTDQIIKLIVGAETL
jgi:hypothetical protein